MHYPRILKPQTRIIRPGYCKNLPQSKNRVHWKNGCI